MRTFTFRLGNEKYTFEAANYAEALAQLIWRVGGEEKAALFTYEGD